MIYFFLFLYLYLFLYMFAYFRQPGFRQPGFRQPGFGPLAYYRQPEFHIKYTRLPSVKARFDIFSFLKNRHFQVLLFLKLSLFLSLLNLCIFWILQIPSFLACSVYINTVLLLSMSVLCGRGLRLVLLRIYFGRVALPYLWGCYQIKNTCSILVFIFFCVKKSLTVRTARCFFC